MSHDLSHDGTTAPQTKLKKRSIPCYAWLPKMVIPGFGFENNGLFEEL